jgi:hypothetical protein
MLSWPILKSVCVLLVAMKGVNRSVFPAYPLSTRADETGGSAANHTPGKANRVGCSGQYVPALPRGILHTPNREHRFHSARE